MEVFLVADGSLIWFARTRTWCDGPQVRNLKLAFLHSPDKKQLTVTIDDVWEDDLYTEDLIPFLLKQGVIDGEWVIVKTDDTDGRTYIEETYTTIVIERR